MTHEQPATNVWIIRGAPAVGKSSVAKNLQKELPRSAVIEVDVLRKMLTKVDWADVSSHRRALRQSATLANSFVRSGVTPVIIVDTLMGNFVSDVVDELEGPPLLFTLVADDETLRGRAERRTHGFGDLRVIREMNEWFRTHRNAGENVIETARQPPQEIARRIILTASEAGRKHPQMGRLVLVRHGKTAARYDGPYDVLPGPPLSARGIEQAKNLARTLSEWEISAWVSSPFERALETASLLSGTVSLINIAKEWAEIELNERFRDVRKRVQSWLEANSPRPGHTVVVVGHGATLNAAIEHLAPSAFGEMAKDRHGNVVPTGSAWVSEWEGRQVVRWRLVNP